MERAEIIKATEELKQFIAELQEEVFWMLPSKWVLKMYPKGKKEYRLMPSRCYNKFRGRYE